MRNMFGRNSFMEDDTANPMDGVSNMSDAMLVLAVGIMLALVINWKIDIGQYKNDVDASKMEQVTLDEKNAVNDVSEEEVEANYEKVGSVYKDSVTGDTFIIVD